MLSPGHSTAIWEGASKGTRTVGPWDRFGGAGGMPTPWGVGGTLK